MAGGTVRVHLDGETIARLRSVAAVENRSPSQIQAVAVKFLLDLSPGARRVLFALDGITDETERKFAAKAIGRAVLASYDRIIDGRHRHEHHPDINDMDSEAAIEAEAARLCRT